MNNITLYIFYYFAVALTVSRNIVQLYNLIKLRLVYSVSILSQFLYLTCTSLWIIYSILLWDPETQLGILITNVVNGLLTLVLIILIFITKKRNNNINNNKKNQNESVSQFKHKRLIIDIAKLLDGKQKTKLKGD